MQTDPQIIEMLNDVLTAELTAVNQYFVHAKLCDNWGYERLAAKIRHESIDEMKHAEQLMERILYFDGHPNLQRLSPIRVGETVEEAFRKDLKLELAALERLNEFVARCRDLGDNGTRKLFEDILVSEEEHTDWLETQLSLISDLGLQGYLAEQMETDG